MSFENSVGFYVREQKSIRMVSFVISHYFVLGSFHAYVTIHFRLPFLVSVGFIFVLFRVFDGFTYGFFSIYLCVPSDVIYCLFVVSCRVSYPNLFSRFRPVQARFFRVSFRIVLAFIDGFVRSHVLKPSFTVSFGVHLMS